MVLSPPTRTRPSIRSKTPTRTAHAELYRNPHSREAERQLLVARMEQRRRQPKARSVVAWYEEETS
ncbi:unnamed protein product [Penicillium roqueforti FM164]|uniref:Uncharacterized protein n=1 Tax=Penicillium roqueforti (strain FM164) TaxID=1365484 RepID=W6QSX4_PENRF|nr:unnamed protein product [Penicillium roqueforti FM164]